MGRASKAGLILQILICAALTASAVAGQTAHYFLDPVSGVDQPVGGTQSLPWKTITYGLSQTYGTVKSDLVFHLGTGVFAENPTLPSVKPNFYTGLTFTGQGEGTTEVRGDFSFMSPWMNRLVLRSLRAQAVNVQNVFGLAVDVAHCTLSSLSLQHGGYRSQTNLSVADSRLGSLHCSIYRQGSLEIKRSAFTGGSVYFHGDDVSARTSLVISETRFTDCPIKMALPEWNVTLRNCWIRRSSGSGVYAKGQYDGPSWIVEDTVFESCKEVGLNLPPAEYSGATCTVRGCLFRRCGVGLVVDRRHTAVEACCFDDNAEQGARFLLDTHHPSAARISVERCRISNNGKSGLLFTVPPLGAAKTVRIASCMVIDNQAGVRVTGSQVKDVQFTLEGCTLVGNGSPTLDLAALPASMVGVNHTILSGPVPLLNTSTGTVFRRCLSPTLTLPGTGNLKADPRFRDPARGVYRLRSDSPALDAGDALLIAAATDFEGDPRSVAIKGTAAVPDIGADELLLQGSARPFYPPFKAPGMLLPELKCQAPMRIGKVFFAELAGTRSPDGAFWVLGLSENRDLVCGALPLGLQSYLGIGGFIYPAIDLLFPAPWSAIGGRPLRFTLPGDKQLVGFSCSLQGVVFGPEGFAGSAMVRCVIGE